MKRYISRVGVLLLAAMLISCGGGGGADSPSGGATSAGPGSGNPNTPPSSGGGNPSTPPSAPGRFEENDAAVSFSPGWTDADPHAGWSGGNARQTTVAQATATFTFTGTSVRWLASRGRDRGIATVSVDGGTTKGKDLFVVDLFARPNDEFSTPAITIYDLSPGPHTLTIMVTGDKNEFATSNVVVVDAFDVEPQILSHFQEDDPDVAFGAGWDQANTGLSWSGSGAGNAGEPVVGAKVTETAGATVTVKFRGTSITWRGYRGPDGGMASVQVDGGTPKPVDTYGDTFKVQEAVFTESGLADTNHTLTITATGQKNAKSTAARIFVDAFDVTTPGRRWEASRAPEGDPAITYVDGWVQNVARVWSQGAAATSSQLGATATFTFVGTSVSWIGCEKSTIGTARISIDGAVVKEINMNKPVGIEGFQRTVFRQDGLTNGPHTLQIEVTSNNGNFVVVDAFDVHPSP